MRHLKLLKNTVGGYLPLNHHFEVTTRRSVYLDWINPEANNPLGCLSLVTSGVYPTPELGGLRHALNPEAAINPRASRASFASLPRASFARCGRQAMQPPGPGTARRRCSTPAGRGAESPSRRVGRWIEGSAGGSQPLRKQRSGFSGLLDICLFFPTDVSKWKLTGSGGARTASSMGA